MKKYESPLYYLRRNQTIKMWNQDDLSKRQTDERMEAVDKVIELQKEYELCEEKPEEAEK